MAARGGIIYQKKGADYYYYHYNPWPGRHKGDVVALTDGTAKLAAFYEYGACLPAFVRRRLEGVQAPFAPIGGGHLSGQGGNTITQAEKTRVENPPEAGLLD